MTDTSVNQKNTSAIQSELRKDRKRQYRNRADIIIIVILINVDIHDVSV